MCRMTIYQTNWKQRWPYTNGLPIDDTRQSGHCYLLINGKVLGKFVLIYRGDIINGMWDNTLNHDRERICPFAWNMIYYAKNYNVTNMLWYIFVSFGDHTDDIP